MFRRVVVFFPVAILLWLTAGLAVSQQVRRLPEVLPASEAFPVRQLGFVETPDGRFLAPDGSILSEGEVLYESAEPLIPGPYGPETRLPGLPLEAPAPINPDRPPDARDGMFQKLTFSETWLMDGSEDDSFGMNEVELKTVLAVPIPSRDFPLIITPGFAVRYLEGPRASDLPPRVYDAYTQFRWFRRYTPRWASDLAVAPGIYSDFEQGGDEGLRITGHGAALFDWTPTTRIIFGVAYLDRDDLQVLPIGGIIWKPNPEWEFKIAAPRPEIARRVYWSGFTGDRVQDWLYLAGELGGGTWAIEREGGAVDRFTYRDFRAMLGIRRKAIGTLDGWLEVGYVFGREIEYESDTPDVSPSDTILVRAGLTY